MVMPFLRLVLIYVVVALAAVVFFNRDSVLPMIGWPWFGGSEITANATTSSGDDTTADDTTSAKAPDTTTAATQTETAADTFVASSDAAEPAPADTAQNIATLQDKTAEQVAQEAENRGAAVTGAQTVDPIDAPEPKTDTELQAMQNDARQAFRNGDFAKTEELYKSMAASNPDHVNIIGELGNFYYSQRRMSDAATYYHMAGKLLIDQGNANQAMSLMGVLQSIDPARAADLRAYGTANQ